ncbi:hypothetical protein EXIGLDRAFT_728427 [Exidia glandulosa HHB12029]|uniref:Zn(2)-C6 fungal-type domain-containing protein n=1 Tax=Exidia glandulosa HHB12029 TaxID=1314781 RepID=A0A165Z4T2_EXIGL|nr:hypothetical protein EXIGLDRAFT_735257 [Exidia glandulosa HHB12029]KZV83392.1 hypothetical protein EXIGLDRAFT_728427 [Exidia glandulosa HHB12029]
MHIPPETSNRRTSRDSGRRVKHVSRSCQECRRRKVKCNGVTPKCSGCIDRRVACDYSGEPDRRHTRRLMQALKTSNERQEARIQQLLNYLENLGAPIPPAPESSPEPETRGVAEAVQRRGDA